MYWLNNHIDWFGKQHTYFWYIVMKPNIKNALFRINWNQYYTELEKEYINLYQGQVICLTYGNRIPSQRGNESVFREIPW